MIPLLDSIAPGTIGFMALAGAMIALAWSPWRHLFPAGLGVASGLALVTWLRPIDVLALAIFVIPPYWALAWLWGRASHQQSRVVALVVIWQILLFLILRGYSGFDILGGLGHPIAVVGLSFILFRQLHLLVDAPANGALRLNFSLYLTYLLAFWTLIAGPLQRYEPFLAGLKQASRPHPDTLLAACHRGVNGLLKAFILAPLFLAPSRAIGTEEGIQWQDAVVLFYAFPIYLYLNFSGYTDIVISLARLCGIETMPENFNRPWLARNVQDFWSRWHISFSSWIRDYLFLPLHGTLYRRFGRQAELGVTITSVLVTFVVVGAWHGPAPGFILFGALHGLGVLLTAAYGAAIVQLLGRGQARRFESHLAIRWIAIIVCFHYVSATFLVFDRSLEEIQTTLQTLGSVGATSF